MRMNTWTDATIVIDLLVLSSMAYVLIYEDCVVPFKALYAWTIFTIAVKIALYSVHEAVQLPLEQKEITHHAAYLLRSTLWSILASVWIALWYFVSLRYLSLLVMMAPYCISLYIGIRAYIRADCRLVSKKAC